MKERRIIDALLAKTVANGCTPGEAAAARAKAEEIAKRGGVDLPPPGGPRPQQPRRPSFGFSVHPNFDIRHHPNFDIRRDDINDLLRDIEAAVRASHRAKSARREPDDWEVKAYRTIGEMAREQLLKRFVIRERGEVVADGAGLPLREVLKRVRARFPDCKTTVNTLRWHESQLRREGKEVPKRWDQTKRRARPR